MNLKQKVLKALANPPRIFYVPYNLAMLNFFFWFLVFVVCMVILLLIPPHTDIPMWLPLAFLGLLCLSHTIFGIYSRQDSQIAQIILSTIRIFNKRIPFIIVLLLDFCFITLSMYANKKSVVKKVRITYNVPYYELRDITSKVWGRQAFKKNKSRSYSFSELQSHRTNLLQYKEKEEKEILVLLKLC